MKKQPFQPGSPGIRGTFDKEQWAGPREDRAESLGEVQFDATDYIVQMNIGELRKVKDNDETSDGIGQAHVDHDGPFEVRIESAICEFFKVSDVTEITNALLQSARKWLQSQPAGNFRARVSVTTYIDLPISARHISQVRRLALETAKRRKIEGDIRFCSVEPLSRGNPTES